MRKPTKSELARMLGVSEEDFHRAIKPLIKRDFREELSEIMEKTLNPDVWLDDQDNIILVNPNDSEIMYKTGISIMTYK